MYDNPQNRELLTIVHSTHSLNEFLAILEYFNIELVMDIRSNPGSRKFPQFNGEALKISHPESKIHYKQLKSFGRRRKVNPVSKNTSWRYPAFRGYANYMESTTVKDRILELQLLALENALPACALKRDGGVVTNPR